ncbi:4Fe-4S dicluster domain-containing protein [bacterium]|nr:4Fe-4S dicluster domain-containing protein [candidate division CSSED10-310 bacterium]
MKRLRIYPHKCINCRNCELACAYGHHQQFRLDKSRVHTISIGENQIHVPILCLQCVEAACVKACPVGALVLNEQNGLVEYIKERCIRCKACAAACPFGNITVDPDDGGILKCDLCDGQPMCAIFCPTKAIIFG